MNRVEKRAEEQRHVKVGKRTPMTRQEMIDYMIAKGTLRIIKA